MKINATDFKARCLKLMAEVARTREPIIVTKHGKPVAKLVPVGPEDEQPGNYFGCMAGSIAICGDVTTPIVENWEAVLDEEAHLYGDLGVREPKPQDGQK